MKYKSIGEAIANGPNRFMMILGHATLNGLSVRLRVRVSGFSQSVVECTDATRENDSWHQIGGSWPLGMRFGKLLDLIPDVAKFNLTPALLEVL